MDTILTEPQRQQLDGIVHQMTQNGESDHAIQFVVSDFKSKYGQPINSIQNQPPDTTKMGQATFPATGNESTLGIIGKTLGNIPSSAYNFGKNIIDFLNPLNAIKSAKALGEGLGDTNQPKVSPLDVAKEIPGQIYKTAVPQFLQHIFSGDLGKAAATIENDPIGQIAPLIFMARSAAEKIGKGAEFDQAISTMASPITKTASLIKKGVGNLASQTIGASTGAGGSSIKEAFISASEGKDASQSFIKAMRGEITPEEIIQSSQDIVQKIRDNRADSYIEQLKNIGEDTATHDISPIIKELNSQLKKFNIKETPEGLDFSRSSIANNGTARADVQGVYNTVKEWGGQVGDRTGIGLDILKKQLTDFYSPSSQARAFVQGVKSPVMDILNNEVPGYKEMTSSYQKASNLLDEIKSATGIGGNAKPDTVFTKLTTAMKGDKEFRLQVLKEMETIDPTLMNKIAGINLNQYIPRGLIGRGVDVASVMGTLLHIFNPQYIPLLLSTSPRIMGEFVRALGFGADKANMIINTVNQITNKIPTSAAVLSNNPPKKK